MKLTYLGTAAAEGWPAAFCNCDGCRAARRLGGRNIRTRSQALVERRRRDEQVAGRRVDAPPVDGAHQRPHLGLVHSVPLRRHPLGIA